MAEQQAPTPVDGATSSEQSVDSKLDTLLGFTDEPEESAQGNQRPPVEATAEGADPETVEVEPEEGAEPQPIGELELIHNGQRVRVSEEQARNLAQMGYDYSTKMQAVNADKARIQQAANALQAQAAAQAQLLDHAALVRSFDMQLQQFQGADWVRLSQDDPIGYSQTRAQYDALMERRNAAYSQMANAYAMHQQSSGYVNAEVRAMEQQRLQERIPEWRDPAKYGKEASAIWEHTISHYGFHPSEFQGSPVLEDHRAIAILRDAWKYRQAVAASKAKGNGKAPPFVRPGALPERKGDANMDVLRKQLRGSKTREAKDKAFDAILDKKLFGS